MSDFINSTINTKIYNMMQDEHQIITIIDKEAEVKDIGTIVSGDTNSCLLTFEINRFQDGIDLSDKKIRFNYRNSNGKFYDIAVNVKYNDDVIRFSWLLPYSLTQPGGNVIASIDFYGSIEYGEQYSYKTKNFKLSVEKSLGVDDGSDESYNNWAIKIENSVESIQNKIGEIEKDIKAIYVPTKLSEMADDTEHRTVSDSQIDTWNEAQKNVQVDWDEKNINSDSYIKNKPQIPNVTNDLTDELKQSYDDAVEKKHTHLNKSVLDEITQDKIESWNNKSEFDGQYSSLQGIPEDIATEIYVDEKVAVLENVNATLSSRITTIEDAYVKSEDIPVNVSELANDSNYQTADDVSTTLATALEPYAKSVDVTSEINTEIAKVIADAPESFDTLKEMADWISNHETNASAMNMAIQKNKNDIIVLEGGKVDKVEGKGLSTNDYSNDEKNKLAGLSNYDDSLLTEKITSLESEMLDLKSNIASVGEINDYLKL